MYRTLSCLAFCFVTCLITWAKDVNPDLATLAEIGKAKVEIDFSETLIHGLSEEDFSDYEKDWDKDKSEVVAMFIGSLSDGLDGIISVRSNFNTPYTIKVSVLTVSAEGNYCCNVDILKDGVSVASIQNVKADGGSWGSKLNLIKDGAKHTGYEVGRKLRRLISKHKK